MRGWVAVVLMGAFGVAGCDGCHGPPAELRVDGAHPHVRCGFLDPPEARTVRAGGVELSLQDREVIVDGPEGPLRVAAFPGPAPLRHSLEPFIADVAAERPHLVFVVGNVGDTEAQARKTLTEVASGLRAPVLVMAGGRDDATVLSRAFEALPEALTDRVIDARGLWRVVHGGVRMVLVSGAPGGRHARTDTACGFGPEDLEAMSQGLGEGQEGVLLSWAAPEGFGAPGLGGKDGGSAALGDFAEDRSVTHAAFAWPVPGRGMHFAESRRGRGRWLPSPGPASDDVITSMILMRWGPDGPAWEEGD